MFTTLKKKKPTKTHQTKQQRHDHVQRTHKEKSISLFSSFLPFFPLDLSLHLAQTLCKKNLHTQKFYHCFFSVQTEMGYKNRAEAETEACLNEALLFATMCIIGLPVDVHIRDGSVYFGTFHTASFDKENGECFLSFRRKDCFYLALVFELLESYDFCSKWYLGSDFCKHSYLGFGFIEK